MNYETAIPEYGWAEETIRQAIISIWARFFDNIPYLLNQGITLFIAYIGVEIVGFIIWFVLCDLGKVKIIKLPRFVENRVFLLLIQVVMLTVVVVWVIKNKFILFSIF